jgi:pimeloyl-ACP methyl ester carboxylesterase
MKVNAGETEPPVIGIIAGAFNPAFLGFQPTKFFYEAMMRRSGATDFFVTPFCGIAPPGIMYGTIRKEIERSFAQYPPERRKVLIGHSMGGLMAANYLADHPGEVRAVIAIAPVLGPIGVPIMDQLIKRNTAAIAEKLSDHNEPRLHCVGSIHDEIIPVNSALPEMAGDNRYEISTRADGADHLLAHAAMMALPFASQHGLTVHHEEILDRTAALIHG